MNNCHNFNTPVLFLVFNRLDTVKQVFPVIRQVQPTRLFIAADGPRQSVAGELERCHEVRNYVLNSIDWDCEVKTLFREENLGCGKAVSDAITWFFEQVEKGIILEDDILPSLSFFPYCQELLEKYQYDERIYHIAGFNPLTSIKSPYSYYFVRIHRCWGWASWSRAWKAYSFDITDLDSFINTKKIKNIFYQKSAQNYWTNIFYKMKYHEIDTWDYQWTYSILKNDGICINPTRNLITNIGFNSDATHTTSSDNPYFNQERYEIEKIVHPPLIKINNHLIKKMNKIDCGIENNFIVLILKKVFRLGKKIIKFLIPPPKTNLDKVICRKHLIFPSESCIMPELKDIFGKGHQYFNAHQENIPSFYVRELPNAYVFTNREEVWTEKHEIVLDHTTQKKNPMKYARINFKKARKIKGCVVNLSLNELENNYYHWLTECLGRLYLIKKANIKPDYYIVANNLPFQKQWLSILGIEPKYIIPAYCSDYLINADVIVITTFINNWEIVEYVKDFIAYQKIWLPSWVGNQYKEIAKYILKENNTERKNIYITRKNARYRKIINENELIPILTEYNFEIIDLDRLTVIEQIHIFGKAKMIVGIHGAGLVNMFFCGTGVKLLEIYPSHYFDASFRLQAINLGIDYAYLIGNEYDTKADPQKANIQVNKSIFEDALAQFCNS